MTSWFSGVAETNGISMRYARTGGNAQPMVLLHGLTGSGACWTHLARALESECDVVMPDARGHGGSTAPLHGYRYEDHADDVAGLIRSLALSRPVLLGHSMGGMTAALVASRATPDLRGVVLVEPTFLSAEKQREVRDSDVADQHRRALASSCETLVAEARARHPRRARELIEHQARARTATSMAAFDVLTPPTPEYRDVVRAIRVPALLVIADRSPAVTPRMATELEKLNPLLRTVQVPDAGHGLPFDQPERLSEVVRSFVRELG